MLAALVVVGAAACAEVDENIDTKPVESLSFYAEIANDNTRATIEKDADYDNNKIWNTIWEDGDTLVLNFDGDERYYDFVYDSETGKFSCSAEGVTSLVGETVVVAGNGSTKDSHAGKKAWGIHDTTVENFTADTTVKLTSDTSFFRYTYNGDSDITFTVENTTSNALVFQYEDDFHDTITISGKSGENFIAFWTQNPDPIEATLSYSINGVKCNEASLELVTGKVYNLGTLTFPYEASEYSIAGTNNGWDTTATPMYIVGDYCVAYGVEFTGSEGQFKVVSTDNKWFGVDNYAMGTWMTLATGDTGNIYVPAGTYDIYFSAAESKVCVVEAGVEVPAMPVFSLGVVGFGGNWDTDVDMTLEGDYYTLKGVAIAATDTFKIRAYDAWDENYGIASSEEVETVAINADAMYTLAQNGKNMQVAAGTYDLYFNYSTKEFYVLTAGTTPDDLEIPQYKIYVYQHNNTWSPLNLYTWDGDNTQHTGAWSGSATTATETINGYEYMVWTMPRAATSKQINVILNNNASSQTADFALGTLDKDYYLLLNGTAISFIEDKENPVPAEPETPEAGATSEWALVGVFSDWADKYFATTTDANVVVLENVTIEVATGFLVRKPSTEWADKYGAGGVNYIKANHYIVATKDGADICVEATGTYDVYFNISTKDIYVMTAGTDYTTATKQTVSGEEPEQEEPEVTEKVVYLKPNSNWTQANARFAAYFFGGTPNEVWVSMTAVGDGTYQVNLPEGYDYGCNIIFCRMNPGTTANNWTNKWNQTSDLTTPTDGKNLYTVKAGTWDKGGGSWSVK